VSFGKITNERFHPLLRFPDSELGPYTIAVGFIFVFLIVSNRISHN